MERAKTIDVALIYELWNEFAAAVNDGDVGRWITLWIDDGIQMPPGVPRRVGKMKIREAMQSLFDLVNITNMSVQIEEVRLMGDWAYSHGMLAFEMTPKEGGETKRCYGKILDILAKQVDGSWKIAIDCHNYNEASVSAQNCTNSGNWHKQTSTASS